MRFNRLAGVAGFASLVILAGCTSGTGRSTPAAPSSTPAAASLPADPTERRYVEVAREMGATFPAHSLVSLAKQACRITAEDGGSALAAWFVTAPWLNERDAYEAEAARQYGLLLTAAGLVLCPAQAAEMTTAWSGRGVPDRLPD